MGAPSQWFTYDSFILGKSNGTYDLDSDTFNVILMTSSYVPNLETDSVYTDIIANEVANSNGYTTGGVVTAATLTGTSGVVNFNLANPTWTASGGSIVGHYAVIIDNNVTNGGLVAYCQLDIAPADITILDGKTVILDITTNSVYDESRV